MPPLLLAQLTRRLECTPLLFYLRLQFLQRLLFRLLLGRHRLTHLLLHELAEEARFGWHGGAADTGAADGRRAITAARRRHTGAAVAASTIRERWWCGNGAAASRRWSARVRRHAAMAGATLR